MSAQISPLTHIADETFSVRTPVSIPQQEQLEEAEALDMRPARGIAMGMLLSVPVWCVLGAIVYVVL